MPKEKLSKIIKDINKENKPPDGWKKEDKVMTDKEVAASVDLEVSDFSDDGSDIDELRNILDGNT
tara:strand:- start:280 stop:474 length:195 start_codon:yes stop_codon:yes gene_type:complete